MKNKIEMTNLGLLHFFLGLEVCQIDGGIFISQKKYAKDLLKKFGMINCKPATTPKALQEDHHQPSFQKNLQIFEILWSSAVPKKCKIFLMDKSTKKINTLDVIKKKCSSLCLSPNRRVLCYSNNKELSTTFL